MKHKTLLKKLKENGWNMRFDAREQALIKDIAEITEKENIPIEPLVIPKIAEIEQIINELEYSAYNLCDGKKHTDLPKGIIESTGAEETLLIAIRDLKNWVSNFSG